MSERPTEATLRNWYTFAKTLTNSTRYVEGIMAREILELVTEVRTIRAENTALRNTLDEVWGRVQERKGEA